MRELRIAAAIAARACHLLIGTPLKILETDRLTLRTARVEDAAFYHALMNDPAWLRFIGDRGIHTLEDAHAFILKSPIAMQELYGFSLYVTELKTGGEPIGVCGLVKRDTLPGIDIGFAFLPAFRGGGYAFEAASAVMQQAQHGLGLKRILAITNPDNVDSIRLLEKLGLRLERIARLTEGGPETKVFARDF
jgi:RimJ/RimL family protein N-acetyltransferase